MAQDRRLLGRRRVNRSAQKIQPAGSARLPRLAGCAAARSRFGNDLLMMLEIPANALKDAPPAAAQMFSAVKSTSFGMSFGQGFGMQMSVRTKDGASAQSMAQTIQGLISMAAMSQSATPQSTEMI